MVDGYTGRMGSTAQEYGRFLDDEGNVQFEANKPLPASHGMTIVVGWPKGFVDEPTWGDRAGWILKDNRNFLAAVAGFLLLLAYYIPVWHKHGKDPDGGVIVTRYGPPKGFSPASLRYIRQMYYDNKVMTAAIVNLAVKGYLEIEKHRQNALGGQNSIPRRSSRPWQPARRSCSKRFLRRRLRYAQEHNHEVLGDARKKHKKSLQQDYKNHYFKTNGLLNLPAIVIVLGSSLISVNIGNGPTAFVIATIILSFLTTMFFAIIMKRPTIRGRELLDEMLGFKDFLEIAEKDELNLRNPPEKTPELFEMMLPYALALGVEQQWSETICRCARRDSRAGRRGLQPVLVQRAMEHIESVQATKACRAV